MPRPLFAILAAVLSTASTAAAQSRTPCDTITLRADSGDARAWNAPRALSIVARATCRRQSQLADTALRDYKALARGYLTFLGQLGEGLTEPPRVVQATQVVTEVYWRAPNVSKQRVVGERDTTVLPTDNQFYRDRFSIVQNNFPDVIRVGEGRDVADVPHPLSTTGLAGYDFAVRDSLRIRVGGNTLAVIELQVRPRDPTRARFVGSLFIDRDDAQVVRMAFTFTRAAYLDKRNEDVSIVLENALVQGRFWLPRHQEVEVRRAGTFLDFPARGIIRGRWEIGDYDINPGIPLAMFAGPPLVFAPQSELRRYPFAGRLLDSLPADVRSVSDEDVGRVQAQARALVQREVLARSRGSALSARSISDFVRVNRVEGLALGAGYLLRLGHGTSLTARGRYGFDDAQAKGRVTIERRWPEGRALRASVYRDFREAGDEPEGSLARNSLAAQELGSDYTDPYDVRGGALGVELGAGWFGLRPSAELAIERQRALDVHARPFAGRYEPTLPAAGTIPLRLTLAVDRPTAAGPWGTELRLTAQLRGSLTAPSCGDERVYTAGGELVANRTRDGIVTGARRGGAYGTVDCTGFARGLVIMHVERPAGAGRFVGHTTLSGVRSSSAVPVQDLVLLGGPTSGPGYDFHQFVGRDGLGQRLEWRAPVPFPAISLGQYGRSPATATIAPYAHTVWIDRPVSAATLGRSAAERGGWYPSLGVGAYLFFDLLRVDAARGLRDGRWTFSVDVARDFWRIL